jgi:hypothetical protein
MVGRKIEGESVLVKVGISAYDLEMLHREVDRKSPDNHGWVFGLPPGIAPEQWPLDPISGYPLMHGCRDCDLNCVSTLEFPVVGVERTRLLRNPDGLARTRFRRCRPGSTARANQKRTALAIDAGVIVAVAVRVLGFLELIQNVGCCHRTTFPSLGSPDDRFWRCSDPPYRNIRRRLQL